MLPLQHFCQGALGQKFQFFVNNGIFLLQSVFISDFWLEFEISASEFTLCQISAQLDKDKRTQILTWNDIGNRLMTSYLPPGEDVSKIFVAFGRFCPRALSCQVWLYVDHK